MINCKHCDKETGWCKLHSDWGDEMPVIEYCVEGPCPDETPITNYDRIHAMSVEEMAAWFLNRVEKIMSDPAWCKSNSGEENGCPHESACVMAWLNSPAEGRVE